MRGGPPVFLGLAASAVIEDQGQEYQQHYKYREQALYSLHMSVHLHAKFDYKYIVCYNYISIA